jgi:hypothetical protein
MRLYSLKEKKRKEKKKKGKIHLTPSNYHPNDNLPPKLLIAIIYPPNYQNNDNVPPILTNDKITLTKILKYIYFFKILRVFCLIENSIGVISSFC